MLHCTYLPDTQKRFFFNCRLELIDGKYNRIIDLNKDGTVKLPIDNGNDVFNVTTLLLVAFKEINVPIKEWYKIEPIYKDGDVKNTNPSNLAYRFSKPIEVNGYSEYYYIPYHTNYGITRSGSVINIRKGNQKSWYREKPDTTQKNIRRGYFITSIKRDAAGRTNGKRHRLLALTFKPYMDDPDELIVNHKNGIGGDDRLDNIEWSTYSENTEHAYALGLYSNKTVSLLVRFEKTNEIKKYDSIASFCREQGYRHSAIRHRLQNHPGKMFSDGIAVKYDVDTPWSSERVKAVKTNAIIVHNVFTGINTLTTNQTSASLFTGVDVNNIQRILRVNSEIPCNGFLFKRASDEEIVFPTFNRWQLELFKIERPKSDTPGWLIIDTFDQSEKLMLLKDCIDLFGLSRSQTMIILKRGKSECGRYIFRQVKPNVE